MTNTCFIRHFISNNTFILYLDIYQFRAMFSSKKILLNHDSLYIKKNQSHTTKLIKNDKSTCPYNLSMMGAALQKCLLSSSKKDISIRVFFNVVSSFSMLQSIFYYLDDGPDFHVLSKSNIRCWLK